MVHTKNYIILKVISIGIIVKGTHTQTCTTLEFTKSALQRNCSFFERVVIFQANTP